MKEDVIKEITKTIKDLSLLFAEFTKEFERLGFLVESLNESGSCNIINDTDLFASQPNRREETDVQEHNISLFPEYDTQPSSTADTNIQNEIILCIPNLDEGKQNDKELMREGITNELEPINTKLKELYDKSCSMYSTHKEPSVTISNIISAFEIFKNRLVESINTSEQPTDDLIKESLIKALDIYGWTNTFIRIYTYANIKEFKNNNEKFKFNLISPEILEIGKDIIYFYVKNGIELVIPELLKTVYRENIHIYDNSNPPHVQNFCDINQKDYANNMLIYDIIKPGYMISNNNVIQKPIVYYI